MIRKIFLLVLTAAVFILCVSCGKQDFGHAEMKIPLNSDFEAVEIEGYDAAYSDGEKIVAAMRISFEAGFNQGIPETFTPQEFAAFYLKEVGRDAEIQKKGYLAFCEYEIEDSGTDYYYMLAFYRTKFAYFTVLFTAPLFSGEELREDFLKIAESIYFEY